MAMRQPYEIKFVVTMDMTDAQKVREYISHSVSWSTVLNKMFRDSFNVEVDVSGFTWHADGPAYEEATGPMMSCLSCKEPTPIRVMRGPLCKECAYGERVVEVAT